MPGMGWLKDAVDIIKDTFEVGSKASEVKKNELEMRKTHLEIESLEQEQREKPLITLATYEQVEKYDETTLQIQKRLRRDRYTVVNNTLSILLWIVTLLGVLLIFPFFGDVLRDSIKVIFPDH